MNLNSIFGKLLGTSKFQFEEVQIDKEVIDEIINIAREAYPNEFMALLEGRIKNKILKITGLVFLPIETSQEGAVMQVFMQPLTINAVGSVHSHPGPSANPSSADLEFFSKRGLFHIIIAEPFDRDSIRTYDSYGDPASYRII